MQNYMLIYQGGDPEWCENTTPEEMAESMKRWSDWMEDLQGKDLLIDGGCPLNYNGKRIDSDGIVTDIAAMEFKELVSGFSIIKASNYDQAIEIAKACPIFNSPNITVEVREVMNLNE
jgi:hypothetical protein